MEETKQIVKVHYAKFPEESTKMKERFDSRDKNKSGKVSVLDIPGLIELPEKIDPAQFDGDKDGYLVFDEFLTLNYLVVTKRAVCSKCNSFMVDKFYICLICHQNKGAKESYNLCSRCYYAKEFNHEHDEFIDSDSLFWEMKEEIQAKGDSYQITADTSSSQSNGEPSKPRTRKRDTIKNALKGISNAMRCFGDVADAVELIGELQD